VVRKCPNLIFFLNRKDKGQTLNFINGKFFIIGHFVASSTSLCVKLRKIHEDY
jgi:hypothetical protein